MHNEIDILSDSSVEREIDDLEEESCNVQFVWCNESNVVLR